MRFSIKPILALVIILCFSIQSFAQSKWYNEYAYGLEAVESQQWNVAVQHFLSALQVKSTDSNKTRAFGATRISYYPNREIGICYYHLGENDKAREYLNISLSQVITSRARNYLNKVGKGSYTAPPETGTKKGQAALVTPLPAASSESDAVKVGERLSIAVLPFESKGLVHKVGTVDLLDKLITGFVNTKRFKVIERAQLEKILAEQKLGLSGVIDASTAAEIGKGIGVDAVVVGSVTEGANSVSVDARFIDTETATIIVAKDAFANDISFQSISNMILELSEKIKNELPVVNGYVININADILTLDIGYKDNIKKGMKCTVYREGDPIIHPVTGQVVGKMINQICEAQITDVFDGYSISKITRILNSTPNKLDKIVTK